MGNGRAVDFRLAEFIGFSDSGVQVVLPVSNVTAIERQLDQTTNLPQ